MSNSNCIRITLNIKDQNIVFGEDYIKLEVINKIETQVLYRTSFTTYSKKM